MDSKGLKIFLACALGAFIGTVISLEVNRWFWWLGILAGGLTGYLSYEFRAVIVAVPIAWKRAGEIGFLISLLAKLAFWAVATATAICSWPVLFWGIYEQVPRTWCFTSALFGALTATSSIASMGIIGISAIFGVIIMIMACFECVNIILGRGDHEFARDEKDHLVSVFQDIIFTATPPVIIFWKIPRAIPGLVQTLFRAMQRLVAAIRIIPAVIFAIICFFGRFFRNLFLLIHSQERIICLVDSALGVIVGHTFGSAVVGAILGGLFGVVNYELVTKRWLVPAGLVKPPSR